MKKTLSNIRRFGPAVALLTPALSFAQGGTDPAAAAATGLGTATTDAGSTSALVVGCIIVGVILSVVIGIVRKA